MIARFSLYGFLKNMQFFEPFLVLYMLQKGFSYLQIGTLASFRSLCINIMEVPSGAVADLYGKKNTLMVSLSCYIISFLLYAFADDFYAFLPAVFLFSIGESFRTGTHKAMIFEWLNINDRLDQRIRVYGYTRSWSKIGSAVSVIISSVIVFLLKDYFWIFILSVVPYMAGIINIMTYPSFLNKRKDGKISIHDLFHHLAGSIRRVLTGKKLRSLIIHNMGFEGVFRVSRDYIQPVVKAQAVILSAYFLLPEVKGTALVIGAVYFILYMISAGASRKSYRIVEIAGSEYRSILGSLIAGTVIILMSGLGLYFKFYAFVIIMFILLYLLQNIWRPVLVSLYDRHTSTKDHATILSVESQAKSFGVLILAPAAGAIADFSGIHTCLLFLGVIMLLLAGYSFYTKPGN